MANHEIAKIDHENHLLLDQSLLRLPHELLRKNFRSAHVVVERDKEFIKKQIKEAAVKSCKGTSTDELLKSLDAIITRSRKLKSKLEACQAEESRLLRQTEARIDHLGELQELHTFDDVKYETWSQARLNRLLVDYLLRQGYSDTARGLANAKDISDLVDIETFVAMFRIENSLRLDRSVTEALAWCMENRKELRKINSNLEFNLRFQQYIEYVRLQTQESLIQAMIHAKKFLYPYQQAYPEEVIQAAGLLSFRPDSPGCAAYGDLFSHDRWTMLADLFKTTHNELLSLPPVPLLHVALSSGLSALKTPACHSHSNSQCPHRMEMDDNEETQDGNDVSAGGGMAPNPDLFASGKMCPICSAELNELARNVPYAHHSKSHVDHDLMLLPNGRVYGLQRLMEHARKQGVEPGKVKDLRSHVVYDVSELKKVYIT